MMRVVRCATCDEEVRFVALGIIDADRHPDQRTEIIDRTFQQKECPRCGNFVRAESEFIYFERSRNQWITAQTWGRRLEWRHWEEQAQSSFDVYWAAQSSVSTRMREAPLNIRITFGWEALREKIITASRGLDDVKLELFKMDLLRNSLFPADDDSDLRLLDADEAELMLGRVVPPHEEIVERVSVPRAKFDGFVADGFQARLDELARGMYVDLRRVTEAA